MEQIRSDSPPLLAPSRSDDHDESKERDCQGHYTAAGLGGPVFHKHHEDSAAFLKRYETMLRQQDSGNIATLDHIRPCLERLEQLIQHLPSGKTTNESQFSTIIGLPTGTTNKNKHTVWDRELRFSDLKRVVEALDQSDTATPECLTTDRQLMMILRRIVQHVDDNEANNAIDLSKITITWAELVHCYKICVSGMETLQLLQYPSSERSRIRFRTLALIALFDNESTSALNAFSVSEAIPQIKASLSSSLRLSTTLRDNETHHNEHDRQHESNLLSLGVTKGSCPSLPSLLLIVSIVVLTSFLSVCLQEHLHESQRAAIEESNWMPRNGPLNVHEEQHPSTPQPAPQHSVVFTSPMAKVQPAISTKLPLNGRSAASLPVQEPTAPSTLIPDEVERVIVKPRGSETGDVKGSNPMPTLLGAFVIGPLAALLAQTWNIGPVVSASSILPILVFGAGIVSIVSVAFTSTQSFWTAILKKLQRKEKA